MRIGIDCSCLAKPERTGVARYATALLGALPAALGPDDRVVQLYRVSRLRRRRWFLRVHDPRFTTGLLNDRILRLHPGGLELVHGPDLRIPNIPHVPAVSTVHDLSALDQPEIAARSFRHRKERALAEVARRAAVIVCISEFTEAQLLRRHPEAAGRTRVIPQGISTHFRPMDAEHVREVRRKRGLAAPFLLFVGQLSARKNLKPLVEAFARLHAAQPGRQLDLVLAGPQLTGGDEVVAQARALPVAGRVHFLGYVHEEELPALYTGAEAFCFPGKAEGFGMPPLEAMACGCPVVAAGAGANRTTCGDAALFFDPDDAHALAAALERVLARGAERDELIARGLRRAAQFSWRETARKTVEAYRDAPARVPSRSAV